MKKIIPILLIFVFIPLLTLSQEIQITADPAAQSMPSIDGNKIVYRDFRNGNADVYLFDLATNNESRITYDTATQSTPIISGDLIVYYDYRNGHWEIYLYDLKSMSETRITNNPSRKENLDFNGRWIAWLDWRTDINECPGWVDPQYWYWLTPMMFFYDLQTDTEAPLQELPPNPYLDNAPWGRPSISGDLAVYRRKTGGDLQCACEQTCMDCCLLYEYSSIELADLSQFPDINYTTLIGYPIDAVWADISGDNVIYGIMYDPAIYLRELSTGEDRMIIADGGNARIDGDRVVYTRVGYLWYYEISTGVETQVPVDPIANYAPSISGNRIVYTADRSGNLDIFMYEIPAPPPPAPSASNEAVSPEERMTEVFCAGLQSPWAMLGPLGLPLLAVCLFRLSFRRK